MTKPLSEMTVEELATSVRAISRKIMIGKRRMTDTGAAYSVLMPPSTVSLLEHVADRLEDAELARREEGRDG